MASSSVPDAMREDLWPYKTGDFVLNLSGNVTQEEYMDHYKRGMPLFTRETLQDIDMQLHTSTLDQDLLSIENINGSIDTYLVQLPLPRNISLGYNSYQEVSKGERRLIYLWDWTPKRSSPKEEREDEGGGGIGRIGKGGVRGGAGGSGGSGGGGGGGAEGEHEDLSPAALESRFKLIEKEWTRNPLCGLLSQYLVTVDNLPKITKIVCFDLGGFSGAANAVDMAFMQHSVARTIKFVLEARFNHAVTCVAQDALYDPKDTEFLQKLLIRRVDDPRGWLEVDDETLVISLCPGVCVMQILADIQWPAAILTDMLPPNAEAALGCAMLPKYRGPNAPEPAIIDGEIYYSSYVPNPCSSRVWKMLERYSCWDLPEMEPLSAWEPEIPGRGTHSVYIRR